MWQQCETFEVVPDTVSVLQSDMLMSYSIHIYKIDNFISGNKYVTL